MSEIITAAEFRARYVDKVALNQGAHGKSKYKSEKTERNGLKFDSKGEADRYNDLKSLENAGEITALQTQVKFKLEGTTYTADFTYFDYNLKKWIVEDFKGFRTTVYKNKRRSMKERYGIEILETKK